MRFSARLAVVVGAIALGACTFDEGELASGESDLEVANGNNLNGNNLNGNNLNGNNLNGNNLNTSELGRFVKWIDFGGARHNGQALHSVHLEGSELVGRRKPNVVIRGTQIAGAIFRARSDDNHSLTLRVVDAFAPSIGDIWRYTVQYQETDGSWQPICTDNGTNLLDSVAVDGWWNLDEGSPGDGSKQTSGNRFLFACRDVGAIGKCIDAGYRPWATVNGVQLGAHHEACVRLLRADYCGNSVSHTVDGQLVNLYDNIGIQFDTNPWVPEAEWTTAGATCISPFTRSIDEIDCAAQILTDDCATSFTVADPDCDEDSDEDSDSSSSDSDSDGDGCGETTLLLSESPQDQ